MVEKPIDKTNIYTKPSFYAQIVSGLIMIYCIYLYLTIKISSEWENLIALIGIAIIIGLHGLAHVFMEENYIHL